MSEEKTPPYRRGRYSSHRQDFYRALGERLREVRQKAGITQKELAKMVKKSRTTITKMEAGDATYLHVVFDIAQAVGISLDDLVSTQQEGQ